MAFTVSIQAGSIVVEPGQGAPVAVQVTNEGDEAGKFELEIEGLDPEWTAVPVPLFQVKQGESHVERFYLKPPRVSESLAGLYPYVVKVRSLETGEWVKAQGVMEVKAFHHLSVDMNPKRVTIPYGRPAEVEVALMNLGNAEHNVQLFANDQDGLFAFELDADQAAVGPGQQKNALLTVTPTKKSLLANPRLAPFSVTARSIDSPSVAAGAQGQVEQRALLTPGAFIAIFLVFLLGLMWWVARPQPPRVLSLSVSPSEAEVGREVTISWKSANAESVRLRIGEEVLDRQPATGEHKFTPTAEGSLLIKIRAVRDSSQSLEEVKEVAVKNPPSAPEPVIERFEISPRSVKLGQSIQVNYKLGPSVVKASLSPLTDSIDPRAEGVQFPMNVAGEFNVKLIATNLDGKSVERTIRVTVSDSSLAMINDFTLSPKEVPDDSPQQVRVTWRVASAVRVELKIGDGQPSQVDAVAGSSEVTVMGETKITITAYDVNGKTTTKTATVTRKAPVEPPPPTNTGGAATTGTTGTIPPN